MRLTRGIETRGDPNWKTVVGSTFRSQPDSVCWLQLVFQLTVRDSAAFVFFSDGSV